MWQEVNDPIKDEDVTLWKSADVNRLFDSREVDVVVNLFNADIIPNLTK